MEKIIELKAQVYDLIGILEQMNIESKSIQKKISELNKQIFELNKTQENDNSKTEK